MTSENTHVGEDALAFMERYTTKIDKLRNTVSALTKEEAITYLTNRIQAYKEDIEAFGATGDDEEQLAAMKVVLNEVNSADHQSV